MKTKKTNNAKVQAGILNSASGRILGLVIQKNGVIRAEKVYVKNRRKRVL